ncbi:MAG: ribonuclease III [Clostridia bacterium]|nr:ribonuclease III [Clostridia bacterium]MBR3593915.1 ribonuclease III [Clostridia bacterium]
MEKPIQLNPATLAFMGDGVYGLLVRQKLCEISRPSGELHSLSVKLVNATAQAKSFKVIEPLLSERELSVFKRGRNAHTSTTPKNSTNGEYHTATGLEALFGFLYLDGQTERMNELFSVIWNDFSDNI